MIDSVIDTVTLHDQECATSNIKRTSIPGQELVHVHANVGHVHRPVRTQYTYSSTMDPRTGATVLRAGVASAKTVPAAFRRAGP